MDSDELRGKIKDCARRHEDRMATDPGYRDQVETDTRIYEAHRTEVEELEEQTGERHL
jgi:hypothetical protein